MQFRIMYSKGDESTEPACQACHQIQPMCYHARMHRQGSSSFGDALRAAIAAARSSQAKLARELHIDPGQVSRWVNGKTVPHIETVARIGQALDTDLSASFAASAPQYELYVSAPIMGLSPDNIDTHHASVDAVVSAARTHVNSIYWPGEAICTPSDLAAPDIATERNMKVLEHCSALLYLQFLEIVHPSSSLIELGCALGRRLKTTVIMQADLYPVFMLDGFGAVAASVGFLPKARVYKVRTVKDACDLIARNGRELLGLS
jgi:transcriptional regulator with XRE-family HTH domain